MGTTTHLSQPADPNLALQEPLFDLGTFEFPLQSLSGGGTARNIATQFSSDSACEAGSNRSGDNPSSRGESWELNNDLEELSRRQSSLGEKQKWLSATANSKNRAAQKRYRERQKGKMETYKQQVDDLGKKLGLLQTENESLEKRNRLLEKVVQMKDQKPRTPPSQATEAPEENANNIWQNPDTYAAVADYVNTIRKNKLPLVTPQDAVHISPEDFRQVKLEYVKELAALLLARGDEPGSEVHRQLEEYVLQARLVAMNLLTSMSVRSFAQVLALKKRLALNALISERIMLALKLTPDQKRDYIAARRALVARNEAIKARRRGIIADLELAVPSVAPLMCGQTSAMLRSCESSDQFKASLEEEHRSMVQFHIDCVQLLTPLQEARCLLEAHPGSPDPWLISGYLEAEQGGWLKEWLQSHSNPGPAATESSRQPVKAEAGSEPSTAEYRPPFVDQVEAPAAAFEDGTGTAVRNDLTEDCIPSSKAPGLGSVLPMNAPNLEPIPLQSTPEGLVELLSSPSLDPFANNGLESFDQDDMWVDFFPGLLTQTQV